MQKHKLQNNFRPIILCLFVTAVLTSLVSGCDDDVKKSESECGAETPKSVIQSMVKENIEDRVIRGLAVQAKSLKIDKSAVRSTIDQFGMSLSGIRTVKLDPNSTKRFCEADFLVSIPIDIFNDLESLRKKNYFVGIEEYASQVGIKYSSGTVHQTIEYATQPTDDNKKVYVELFSYPKMAKFLDQVVEVAFLKPIFDEAEAKTAKEREASEAKAARQQQEQKDLLTAQENLRLDSAKSQLKDANDQINVVWNAASSEFRKQMLPEQKRWLKQREIDCKLKSASSQDELSDTEKEIVRSGCETEMTINRTLYLREKVIVQ